MYNGSDVSLHWEPKSPVTMGPDQHLTEYVLLNTFTNETMINADLNDLRHGACPTSHNERTSIINLYAICVDYAVNAIDRFWLLYKRGGR